MKTVLIRSLAGATALALVLGSAARAQDMPKPGKEHEVLKQLEGTWEAEVKSGFGNSNGTAVRKMEIGGFWLLDTFEGSFSGMPFKGFGMTGYDPDKKKYIGTWVDSMGPQLMVLEGTYDPAKKTLTQTGEGPDMTGKPIKHTMVSQLKDKDTIVFTMYTGNSKEPVMTITYKRKK